MATLRDGNGRSAPPEPPGGTAERSPVAPAADVDLPAAQCLLPLGIPERWRSERAGSFREVLPREVRRAALELRTLPGLGEVRRRQLLSAVGPEEALRSAGAEVPRASAFVARTAAERARRSLALMDRLGHRMAVLGVTGYPAVLAHLPDPPTVLFARGDPQLLERPVVAVVGSRRATAYGEEVTRALVRRLCEAGATVLSGLARGIDGFAHEEALAHGTAAVLGCGLDVAYPWSHRDLQAVIGERGLLLSEFLPGTPPLRHHFPLRNRLLAALADGVVVVEAPERSGALITAKRALDMGREVFAVPGPLGRPASAGCNRLIRDGAHCVADLEDVVRVLGLDGGVRAPSGAPPQPPELGDEALLVWHALSADPEGVDFLTDRTGLPAPTVLHALLELELAGRSRSWGGGRFVRL